MANKKLTKEDKGKEQYLLQDEELDEVEDVERTVSGSKFDIEYDPITGKFRNPEDFTKYKEEIEKMDPERDSNRLTISDDGEAAIIDTDPMVGESKKKTVVNLSESEIMSILKKTQNPKITKSELIKTIQNNLISEARMNDNVRQGFESGENDYNDILGARINESISSRSFPRNS